MESLGPEALAAMQRIGEIVGDVETEDVPTYEVRIAEDRVLVSTRARG